ncbi:MAG: hypothetical protein UT63_C0022G0007 [Candidatus Gottesmanbacteria bacterium GW2011_GWC2_39_8]|uniref:Cohesin domain-containing protein n=1 Tax=Candidatus Gottesmanbacteria bacterium GW2011_GWC2_39_8 TaxID=1618450 RepID=A0A0G0PYE9_9BACT|nr:MAG: hypothetical protein UT63_C0022G0007 [Candidatus Gottesmanbacteria bacterium GW2011_GWC2_39_8]
MVTKRHNREKKIFYLLLLLVFVLPVSVVSVTSWKEEVRTKAAFDSSDLLLYPKTGTFDAGQNFPVEIKLDSKNTKVSGADITLKFDKNVMEIASYNLPTSTSPFTDAVYTATEPGKIRFTLIVKKNSQALPSSPISLGLINFRGRTTGGTSNLSFDKVQIVGFGESAYDMVVPVGNTESGNFVINETNNSYPLVKINLSLFGAEKTPPLKFSIRAKDDSVNVINNTETCNNPKAGQTDFINITFKAGQEKVYSPDSGVGDVRITSDGYLKLNGINPDKTYTLYIKGGQHKMMKMATGVKFKAGRDVSNNFDFTNKPLLPGDLPDPKNNMKQNCIIDASDVGLVMDRLGKEDWDSLSIADLDYNGVVNAGDMGLLLNTLKNREEEN